MLWTIGEQEYQGLLVKKVAIKLYMGHTDSWSRPYVVIYDVIT